MAAYIPDKPGAAKKTARSDQSLSEGPERIQKLLARAGAGSRREIEGLDRVRSPAGQWPAGSALAESHH